MKKNRTSIIYTIIICIFLSSATLVSSKEAPIHIEADKLTSTEQTNTIVYIGNVEVRQGDVKIHTDKMTVYFSEENKEATSKEVTPTQQVEKLLCEGNVEVSRAKWLGTSKKMTYLAQKRQVILTGKAKAWQDQNMVSGNKIIYYLDEGRSEVVGSTSTTVGKKSGKKNSSRVNMTIIQK